MKCKKCESENLDFVRNIDCDYDMEYGTGSVIDEYKCDDCNSLNKIEVEFEISKINNI